MPTTHIEPAAPKVSAVREKPGFITNNKAPYRFMLRWILVCSPILLLVLIAELFLWLAGETVPIHTVATRYDRNGPPSAYLPGLMGQQFNLLHYERVIKLRPKLLVLGSSRVTRFREEMFGPDADFYNSGRTISCVGDLEEYFRALPTNYVPKTLLLGIDGWWFKPGLKTPARFAEDVKVDDTHSANAHVYAWRKLIHAIRRGQLDWQLTKKILLRQDGGVKRFGLIAWRNSGMRNDGSNQTFDRSTPSSYPDGLPEDIREILKISHPSMLPADHPDDKALHRFEAVLQELTRRGTFVIGFSPPYASEVRKAYLENPLHYGFYTNYQAKLETLFDRNGWHYYDGRDPGHLGLDDRSMKDRDHAQETYHIALLRIMAGNPQVRKALHLDPDYLQALLSNPNTTSWYPKDYRRLQN